MKLNELISEFKIAVSNEEREVLDRMQSISALLIPILFLSIIQNTWIPHEEKKLKEKFPEEWAGYASSTKKWLW